MTSRDATRWLRTVERWLNPRGRVLALLPYCAGLRLGETVALNIRDVHLSARKGLIVVRAYTRHDSPGTTLDHPVSST